MDVLVSKTPWPEHISVGVLVGVTLCAVVLVAYIVTKREEPRTDCTTDPVVAYDSATFVPRSYSSSCDVPPGSAIEVPATAETQYTSNTDTMQRFRDENLGVTTVFRVHPEGYVLLKLPPQVRDSSALVTAYTFITKRDLTELAESVGPREGPQAITLHAYENPRGLSLDAWMAEFAGTINYRSELGEARNTLVAARDARVFRGDGLYPSETVVFEHRSFVIVITGTFNAPEDRIYKDFLDMVGSLALL